MIVDEKWRIDLKVNRVGSITLRNKERNAVFFIMTQSNASLNVKLNKTIEKICNLVIVNLKEKNYKITLLF